MCSHRELSFPEGVSQPFRVLDLGEGGDWYLARQMEEVGQEALASQLVLRVEAFAKYRSC